MLADGEIDELKNRYLCVHCVAYRAALEERTRARVPLDWAMTQNNLTRCLALLDERRKT